MLNVLEKLKYYSSKDELLFFICDVVGHGQVGIYDAKKICNHFPGRQRISVEDIVSYCRALGWVQVSHETVSVSSTIVPLLNDKEKLNDALIVSTISKLFEENIFNSDMFYYDIVQGGYSFKNELLPLSLSVVRNVLISQGFFIQLRSVKKTLFYISPTYEAIIAKLCKEGQKKLTLERLEKQLETNRLAGEKAELFVLNYEKNRLDSPHRERVKQISEVDVAAGYDIVSFTSNESQEFDRFIEVKAVSRVGFYWSKNEYEISKLKGDSYYLYLVELNKIDFPDYSPLIIQNPAVNIMKSEEWFVEAESYFITRI